MTKSISIFNNVKFAFGANKYTDLPSSNLIEFAFWGRSNVGKSSTINSITDNKSMARVSQNPGCTKQINIFTIGDNVATLADLPGYGYAAVSKTIAKNLHELCYDYLHRSRPATIFLLIDSRRGITKIDAEVIEAIQLLKHNICFVFTKTDKVKENDIEKLKDHATSIRNNWIEYNPHIYCRYIFISNKTRNGIDKIKNEMLWYINQKLI